mgnify:CR=1 FL=1|tara:strand:- start:103 stop:366 length:264 start_codon:yes stop_codon:yes gene_type:complete
MQNETNHRYKLTVYPAFELDRSAGKTFGLDTKVEVMAVYNAVADLLLYLQDEITILPDYSNYFTCEQFFEGEWHEEPLDEEEEEDGE